MSRQEDRRQRYLSVSIGRIAAAEWYEVTASRYTLAADRATWPPEELGNLQIARGREWARTYRIGAIDCLRRARRLRWAAGPQ